MPDDTTRRHHPEDGIDDFASFQTITGRDDQGHDHQIAGLYFYQQLDFLIEFACKVSYDFFKRPHLYTNLGTVAPLGERVGHLEGGEGDGEPGATGGASGTPRPLREVLAQLHGVIGYNEFFPGKVQRDEIYRPIFGSGGDHTTAEEGDFPRLRDALLDAAARFAERVLYGGEEMLRVRVVTTHRPFKLYLEGLQGDSIRWSREKALARLTEDVAYPILRSARISGIFGIDEPPDEDWPYKENFRGDLLGHAISKQLVWRDHPNDWYMSREHISNLQRSAKRGAEALAAILDFEEPSSNAEIDLLTNKCYSWRAALLSVSAPSPMPELVAPSGTAGPSPSAMAPWRALAVGPAASSSQVAQMLAPLRPSGEIEPNSGRAGTDLHPYRTGVAMEGSD